MSNASKEDFSASVTFSCSTESHANTVVHGKMAESGYTKDDLEKAIKWADQNDRKWELFDLRELSETPREAYVLVIRDIIGSSAMRALREEYTTKVFPRLDRKFVNFMVCRKKFARGNAEIGDVACKSDLDSLQVGQRVEKGQKKLSGIVLPYSQLPRFAEFRALLPQVLGSKASGLRAEINHYGPPKGDLSDPRCSFEACGIGFHGDGERPDVAAIVIGRKKALHFQGFRRTYPEGRRVEVVVGDGDLYVMCEVACGHNWTKERRLDTVIHYRHAAGPLSGEGKPSRFLPTNEQLRKRAESKRRRRQEAVEKRKRERRDRDTL